MGSAGRTHRGYRRNAPVAMHRRAHGEFEDTASPTRVGYSLDMIKFMEPHACRINVHAVFRLLLVLLFSCFSAQCVSTLAGTNPLSPLPGKALAEAKSFLASSTSIFPMSVNEEM